GVPVRVGGGVQGGAGVVRLADPAWVDAAGGADSPEIEAQSRQAERGAHFLDAHDHWIIHVTAIEWVRMTDHHTSGRGVGQRQERLEAQIRPYRETDGLFGYHGPP